MNQPAPTATPGGVVTVAGHQFLARKLATDGELGLLAALRAGAEQAVGRGGLFERFAGRLAYLADTKQFAVLNRVVDRLTDLEADGAAVTPEQVYAFRQTPAGAALELFHRTRLTHPAVTQQELAAIVTDANALHVSQQIDEAVTDAGKAPAPSASPTT